MVRARAHRQLLGPCGGVARNHHHHYHDAGARTEGGWISGPQPSQQTGTMSNASTMSAQGHAALPHGRAAVRPKVQDTMPVLLAELHASNALGDTCPDAEDGQVQLHPMPVVMGPQTYLEPRLEPGLHFHRLPDLATIRG